MFPVPGWSISADTLRVQTEPNGPKAKAATVHKSNQHPSLDTKKSRKRKRGHGSSSAVKVTDENLGDLWRKHIDAKILHQSQPRGKGKNGESNNEEKDDAFAEKKDVGGGAFEGFSKEDKPARRTEEDPPPKMRKRKRKEKDSSITIQGNGDKDASGTSPPLLNDQAEAQDGKSRYEHRISKALKRRGQKAVLQANGTLPPTRPEHVSSHPTKNAEANTSHTLKLSKGHNALPELTVPDLPGEPGPPVSAKAPVSTQTPTPSVPSTKLTPLQQRMAAKLTSARFRHLNQTLYTSPSGQAMRLFADSPQNYTSYHAGFRAQVAVWPQNPVDGFIEDIKARGTISVPSQKKFWREQKRRKKPKGDNGDAAAVTTTTVNGGRETDPLPRSPNGICTIIDLGCGDATLAGTLSPSAQSLGLKILSFDLATGDTPNGHLITVADISNLSTAGVKDRTVDIAVCCLSLMGTNWVDIVDECARIVRGGGEVWVAEIKSRFARPGIQKKKKVGGGIGRKKAAGKGKDAVGEEDDEALGLEELEDVETKGGNKDETDVGAFVEVFGKRGLVLKGEPDMANIMFVRMRFTRSPDRRVKKGDGERVAGTGKGNMGRSKMYMKTKFVDDNDGDAEEVDESKVLKPCVYKTR